MGEISNTNEKCKSLEAKNESINGKLTETDTKLE